MFNFNRFFIYGAVCLSVLFLGFINENSDRCNLSLSYYKLRVRDDTAV